MKKFMMRGKHKKKLLPAFFEYNVWYELVTPFDWQYFRIRKKSRYVHVYEFLQDSNPEFTVSKKQFVNKILPLVKAKPRKTEHIDELL